MTDADDPYVELVYDSVEVIVTSDGHVTVHDPQAGISATADRPYDAFRKFGRRVEARQQADD